jgi:DNA-binding response OmpR family regulator
MAITVLVVDDNPDVFFSIKNGFDAVDKNYHIFGVENGEKCLEMLQSQQIPDVILLDIMIPQMSGWEIYQKVKERTDWKNIPIIFLTARTDRTAKKAGSFLGDDYIEKPFDIANMKMRIEKILEKNKLKNSEEQRQ